MHSWSHGMASDNSYSSSPKGQPSLQPPSHTPLPAHVLRPARPPHLSHVGSCLNHNSCQLQPTKNQHVRTSLMLSAVSTTTADNCSPHQKPACSHLPHVVCHLHHIQLSGCRPAAVSPVPTGQRVWVVLRQQPAGQRGARCPTMKAARLTGNAKEQHNGVVPGSSLRRGAGAVRSSC